MDKKRGTLAVAGAGAEARSSVTIYGIADVGLTIGRGSVANRTQLVQGNLVASGLGFRSVEVPSGSTSGIANAAGRPAGTARKYAVMGMRSLSRRTTLYALYAKAHNKDGATAVPFTGYATTGPSRDSSALSVGIVHSFERATVA